MNIFAELPASIAGTKRYASFLNNKKGKVFVYLLLITFIYFICTYCVPFISFEMKTGGVKQVILNNVPDFSLENGSFFIETPVNYENETTLYVLDTSVSNWTDYYTTEDWDITLSPYNTAIVADQNTIVIKNNGEIQVLPISNAENISFTRDTLIGYLPFLTFIMAVGCIILFFWHIALYMLGALIVALIGMIICSFLHYQLTYGQLILLSIYAKTLALMAKAVLNLFDVSIFMFGFLGWIVSCIYLGFAIYNLKQTQIESETPAGPVIFS